jgi:hypothetical protein
MGEMFQKDCYRLPLEEVYCEREMWKIGKKRTCYEIWILLIKTLYVTRHVIEFRLVFLSKDDPFFPQNGKQNSK